MQGGFGRFSKKPRNGDIAGLFAEALFVSESSIRRGGGDDAQGQPLP